MSRAFSLRRNRAALRRLARKLARGQRGVAAIEFAFVLPVMLTAYFGIVEIGQGVMVDRKVTQLTRTLGDLASQSTVLSTDGITDIFKAAETVMMPYTDSAPRMTISSVIIDAGGTARVCWSEQSNSTALARGSTVTLPAALKVPGTSLIMAKASYDFVPAIGYLMTGTVTLGNDAIYMRPRTGSVGGTENIEQVERTGRALCPNY